MKTKKQTLNQICKCGHEKTEHKMHKGECMKHWDGISEFCSCVIFREKQTGEKQK